MIEDVEAFQLELHVNPKNPMGLTNGQICLHILEPAKKVSRRIALMRADRQRESRIRRVGPAIEASSVITVSVGSPFAMEFRSKKSANTEKDGGSIPMERCRSSSPNLM
jgi:hypothetical protein